MAVGYGLPPNAIWAKSRSATQTVLGGAAAVSADPTKPTSEMRCAAHKTKRDVLMF
jgi:hypothetical protein